MLLRWTVSGQSLMGVGLCFDLLLPSSDPTTSSHPIADRQPYPYVSTQLHQDGSI